MKKYRLIIQRGMAPESKLVDSEIRQLLHGRRRGTYRALFTITHDQVRILHIRHASRKTLTPSELENEG